MLWGDIETFDIVISAGADINKPLTIYNGDIKLRFKTNAVGYALYVIKLDMIK